MSEYDDKFRDDEENFEEDYLHLNIFKTNDLITSQDRKEIVRGDRSQSPLV